MSDVVLKNITKTYGKGSIKAVTDVSFSVEKGEIFGLIGPDGAGKTTIFRMLTTLLKPDAGEAFVNGLDVVKDYKKIRTRVGYMPGRFSLYQDLTVEENLNFFATVFQTTVAENYELIRDIYVQIEPFKTRLAGKLSGGMKQKLALSCALIHKPEILVLDEPTTGVDAVSRKEFWEMLKKLQQKGITILVSTPYMDEATLCNRVALMQKGKVLDVDTPQKLVENYTRKLYAIRSKDMHRLIQDLRAWEKTDSAYAFGQYLHVTGREDEVEASEFENFLLKKNHEMLEVFDIHPGIEDVFMNLLADTVS